MPVCAVMCNKLTIKKLLILQLLLVVSRDPKATKYQTDSCFLSDNIFVLKNRS